MRLQKANGTGRGQSPFPVSYDMRQVLAQTTWSIVKLLLSQYEPTQNHIEVGPQTTRASQNYCQDKLTKPTVVVTINIYKSKISIHIHKPIVKPLLKVTTTHCQAVFQEIAVVFSPQWPASSPCTNTVGLFVVTILIECHFLLLYTSVD